MELALWRQMGAVELEYWLPANPSLFVTSIVDRFATIACASRFQVCDSARAISRAQRGSASRGFARTRREAADTTHTRSGWARGPELVGHAQGRRGDTVDFRRARRQPRFLAEECWCDVHTLRETRAARVRCESTKRNARPCFELTGCAPDSYLRCSPGELLRR